MSAPSPTPLKLIAPKSSTMPPIAQTKMSATMIILRGSARSTLFFMRVSMPTLAMIPKSNNIMPPMTGAGIVESAAPSLPTKASKIAASAAKVMMAGL